MNEVLISNQVTQAENLVDVLVLQAIKSRIVKDRYLDLRRLEGYCREAEKEGWESLDWLKAHKLGWFCRRDYKVFSGLKNLTYEKSGELAD